MSHAKKEIYEFDNFRLDVSERLLWRDGARVPLSEKAFETLCALVRHGNHLVSKEELLNEIWPEVIVEENNLDKNISLLRQVLGERTANGKFIETVRGHGFRFVPEVRKIEEEANGASDSRSMSQASAEADVGDLEAANEIRNKDRRRTFSLSLTVALTILIVASLAAIYFWRQYPIEASIKILAVLPFKPLVAETKDESLGLGMADALIAKLSGGDEITVRTLPAIRRYSSKEQDPITAGRELGVDAVLDGSIQVSGDRVRVLAKLLRVDDGKQLWAEHFDEKFTDIFVVQDSISERVAAALRIQLGSKDKKRRTQNIEAYQLYMKGRYHAVRLTRAETDKGIDYFQQAIQLDPSYALAYVGLAEAYVPMALTSGEPSMETMPKARAAALKAVELDETLAEPHAVLGAIYFWHDWDWQAAEKQLLQALN